MLKGKVLLEGLCVVLFICEETGSSSRESDPDGLTGSGRIQPVT